MISRYLRVKKRNGVIAIFHELHPDPVFCSQEQLIGIENETLEYNDPLLSQLKEKGLIVETSHSDDSELETATSALRRKMNQSTILYLMTAQGCNLVCKYCPVPETAKKYGELILSIEDAYAGIDLWLEHLKDCDPSLPYFITFYGGEPLLNKDTITKSIDYIEIKRRAGLLPTNLNILIATNGLLVDEETITLCKKHKVMIVVGLDGPQQVNDTMKVSLDGTGTFDQIVKTIKLLVQNNIPTFVSTSITPFNIHEIEKYSDFFKMLGVQKFGFNFLKGRLLVELVGKENLQDYYRLASSNLIKNARLQQRPGFEYQMEKKQNAFDTGDFFPVDCTCYGNQLVIQPDGQISNCPFFKAQLGHIQKVGLNFRIWDQPIVKVWRNRVSLNSPSEAKALNGGGCAWSCNEIKDSYSAEDDGSRIFSEEVLDELIWSRYHQITHSS